MSDLAHLLPHTPLFILFVEWDRFFKEKTDYRRLSINSRAHTHIFSNIHVRVCVCVCGFECLLRTWRRRRKNYKPLGMGSCFSNPLKIENINPHSRCFSGCCEGRVTVSSSECNDQTESRYAKWRRRRRGSH